MVSTITFSSVQGGIYALGKAYMRSTPSQKFPQRCLWNGSNVRLIDVGPFSSFQGRLSSTSFFHASLLQAIDGVMSLALCLQVMSEVLQHFRSSKVSRSSRHYCTITFTGAWPSHDLLNCWHLSLSTVHSPQPDTWISVFHTYWNVHRLDVYWYRFSHFRITFSNTTQF